MGLLQDPSASLEQVEWYLTHRDLEKFPGAFELAAGNLCRQTLEQILLILCFFSGMPPNHYLRKGRTLRTADRLLESLDRIDPTTRKRYWELARRKGPRIRKFARSPRTLKKWRRILNEPSHFSPGFRIVGADQIRLFLDCMRPLFDEKDRHLIVVAVNELFSRGKVSARLANDPDNTPLVCFKVVVTPRHLTRTEDGKLHFTTSSGKFLVISATEVPRGPWPRVPVVPQHSFGVGFSVQFVTKRGRPVNLQDFGETFRTLASTRGQRAYLTRRLRELGYEIDYRGLRMTKYQARVSRAGEVILNDVTVYIEERTKRSGKRSWYGFIQLDRGQQIEAGPYTVQLGDKRGGEILVGKAPVFSHWPARVDFKGSGPLR